ELLDELPDTVDRQRRELKLRVALGSAVAGAKGYARVGGVWARARELCEALGDTAQLAKVLHAQCSVHVVRARFDRMRETGEELVRLGEAEGAALTRTLGHRAIGTALFYRGDLGAACRHLQEALTMEADTQLLFVPISVVALSHLSVALLVSGHVDRARVRSLEALDRAEKTSKPSPVAYARSYRFMVHELCGDVRAALVEAEAYLALSREHGFSMFVAEATAFRGWVLAETGQPTEGIGQLRTGMAAMVARRVRLSMPYQRPHLADAYGREGRPRAERLRQLDSAIALSERTGEFWFSAELYRRRGELLASSAEPDPAAAEAYLRRAIAVARPQGARLWELRAATSLARLWRDRGDVPRHSTCLPRSTAGSPRDSTRRI
ncbi:MAG: hypothetical protein WAS21_12555, partial [Geminicoccaceae bacterium]